jgi:tRNA(adenine34) deaminase
VLSRLRRVIFGCPDPKSGAAGGWINLLQSDALNHRCEVTGGVLGEESAGLLRQFFGKKRAPSAES